MRRPGAATERLVGLFLIGAIGFTPPLLTLFNGPALVAGIPLLYFYVFGLWIALVALARLAVAQLAAERDRPPDDGRTHTAEGASE